MAITVSAVLSVTPYEIQYLLKDDAGTDTGSLTRTNAEILADMILLGTQQTQPNGATTETGNGTIVQAKLGSGTRALGTLAGSSPLRKLFNRPGEGGAAITTQATARTAILPFLLWDITAQSPGFSGTGVGITQWALDVNTEVVGADTLPVLVWTSATLNALTNEQTAVCSIKFNHSTGR